MVDSIPEAGINLADMGSEASREKPERKPLVGQAAAYLADPDCWRNYESEELAEIETMLRDWMEEMSELPAWKNTNSKKRKYTFSMVFQLVTGEKYDQRKHAGQIRIWTTLLRYYSSRVQKSANINGRFYSKTTYVLSPSRLKRPPYSIRLRIPWLIEHGYAIEKRTMENVNADLLEPGHARNPRTEENMRKRSKEARRRYEQWSLSKEAREARKETL